MRGARGGTLRPGTPAPRGRAARGPVTSGFVLRTAPAVPARGLCPASCPESLSTRPTPRNPAWAFAESPGGLGAAGAPSSGRAGQAQDGRPGAATALQGAAAPRPPHLALPRLPSFQPPAPPGGGGPTFTPRLVHGGGPARVSGAYGYPLGTGWVEDDVGVRAEAGCCPQGSPWGLYVLRSLWPLATFTVWVTPAGSPG